MSNPPSNRVFVFADEAGNFDFSRHRDASKYFILTTVTMRECSVGSALLALRRQLAWEGVDITGPFHATTDKQAVRNRVFGTLAAIDFRVDATILEKAKAQPHVRASHARFYQMAWFLHFKYVAPQIASRNDELMVVGASLGTKKQRSRFSAAIDDVVSQVAPGSAYESACWPAGSDPCLQVADYCCWAIQRRWESSDERSYALVQSKIASEFDIWRHGTTRYY